MTTITRKDRTIFFISDAHLGQNPVEDEARVRSLTSFFKNVTKRGGSLFILGDFFDFWFEYRSVIPRGHFKILAALMELASSDVDVIYIGGNHDYWVGSFLENQVGVSTYTDPVDLRAQGRRVFLAHGDGLAGRDWPYRAFRRVLRSRPISAAYRLLHPDLGLAFARWVSRKSRIHSGGTVPDTKRLWEEVGRPRFDVGFDTVVLGHIHSPVTLSSDNRELYVIGDWIDRFTFLVLENGAFKLEHWKPE